MVFYNYTTQRTDSWAELAEVPYALVGASWLPSWSFRLRARIERGRVKSGNGEICETDLLLWSPNASHVPYFPGVCEGAPVSAEVDNPASFPADKTQRRADGHLGPGDAYEFPQYYDPARPWLLFIRRSTAELARSTASHASLDRYLQKMAPDVSKQKLPKRLVEKFLIEEADLKRDEEEVSERLGNIEGYTIPPLPRRYSEHQFRMLVEDSLTWEEMVDHFKQVQRGMRERWAWCRFASAVIAFGRQPWDPKERDTILHETSFLPLLPADETYVGGWFNTTEEAPGRWLMLVARVPAYYSCDSPPKVLASARTYASESPVPAPMRTIEPMKVPAQLRGRWEMVDKRRSQPTLPWTTIVARARCRPHLLGITGWYQLEYPAAKEALGQPHGIICPPRVASTKNAHAWDHFVMWSPGRIGQLGDQNVVNCGEDRPVFLRVPRKSPLLVRPDGAKIAYDRQNKRQYHLDVYPRFRGLEHDIERWGFPLPQLEHYDEGNLAVPLRCGVWAYVSEDPDRDILGHTWEWAEPPPPAADDQDDGLKLPDSAGGSLSGDIFSSSEPARKAPKRARPESTSPPPIPTHRVRVTSSTLSVPQHQTGSSAMAAAVAQPRGRGGCGGPSANHLHGQEGAK